MATLVLLIVCALVTIAGSHVGREPKFTRNVRDYGKIVLPSGCLYNGRWYADGGSVATREACLQCACALGALSCRRRACNPLPEPPPRCHVIQRKGQCCPDILCADGVHFLENKLKGEDTEATPIRTGFIGVACVEGGSVYAAGSAMSSKVACEQCFCLGGARRCVRPKCLPPPPGCHAQPSQGACCPQRYYCDHSTPVTTHGRSPHDCKTPKGTWISEGQKVSDSDRDGCDQCFCLRGTIRCQHLSCAPTLQNCAPLVESGQCCPHQYQCNHTKSSISHGHYEAYQQHLEPEKEEDRSFHVSKSIKRETTVKISTTTAEKVTQAATTRETINTAATVSTPPTETDSTITTFSTQKDDVTSKDISTTNKIESISEFITSTEAVENFSTEQPVRIMINGTINCAAEISSTSLLYNITNSNDSIQRIQEQSQPRIPLIEGQEIEAQTFPASELITERNYNDGFDGESFTINVTSSLRANTSTASTTMVKTTTTLRTPPMLSDSHNISKKTKDDTDYDYVAPTLPPSLPNLKIIPFVAADAVVDEEESRKESDSYPLLEKEDNYPIYYPIEDAKPTHYGTQKESSQYPVFTSVNDQISQYPKLTHDIPETFYAGSVDDVDESPIREFAVSTSYDSSSEDKTMEIKPEVKIDLETPATNLFSPPVETEGGFIPKGPGIIEDYYIHSSTPPGPLASHFTTTMQLDKKGDCVSNDGRQISEGETVNQACSICSCAWGELHCSPRPCSAPAGCMRRAAAGNACCGEIVCNHENRTKLAASDISITTDSNPIHDTVSEVNMYVNDDMPVINDTVSDTNFAPLNLDQNREQVPKANKTYFNVTDIRTTEASVPSTKPENNIETNVNNTNTHFQDYDEEEDDDGFSFGNVLKLLLSETYETTTIMPFRKLPSTINTPKTTTQTPLTTSRKPTISLTNQYSFIPSNKLHNTVNRIDHLVLGEATAIKRPTPRPMTFKPVSATTRKVYPFTKPTTRATTKAVEINSIGGPTGSVEISRPQNMLPDMFSGLPKVAGCNIYGRMYRVGRIIAELSTACQECKCTEMGVDCRALSC